MQGAPADDDGEFGLVADVADIGGQQDGLVRADHRAARAEEGHRLGRMRHGAFGQRIGEVEGRADDLARSQWGQQPQALQWPHRRSGNRGRGDTLHAGSQALFDQRQQRRRGAGQQGLAQGVGQVDHLRGLAVAGRVATGVGKHPCDGRAVRSRETDKSHRMSL